MSTLRVSSIQDTAGSNSSTPAEIASGRCKAWVCYNGVNNTIRASYNVSSVTKSSGGVYTINFTNALPDANYAPIMSTAYGGYSGWYEVGTTRTTTSCSMYTSAHVNFSGDGRTTYDWTDMYVAIFR